MGLMQKEVAEQIGISRGHYIDYEVGYVDYYPKEVVDRLADFYHIPVEDLLDDRQSVFSLTAEWMISSINCIFCSEGQFNLLIY